MASQPNNTPDDSSSRTASPSQGQNVENVMPPNITVNEVNVGENSVRPRALWADLFKENRDFAWKNDQLIPFLPTEEEVVKIESHEIITIKQNWSFASLGSFVGKFPGFKAIQSLVESWKVECKFFTKPNGFVLFKFQSEEDRCSVLSRGPYFLYGKMLTLKALPERYHLDVDDFCMKQIWVRLPYLPMEFWHPRALGKITSVVGVPVCSDWQTRELRRGKGEFARVLVEIDMSKEVADTVLVGDPNGSSFKQDLVFEIDHQFCTQCKKNGHYKKECNGQTNPAPRRQMRKEPSIPSASNFNVQTNVATGPPIASNVESVINVEAAPELIDTLLATVQIDAAPEVNGNASLAPRDHGNVPVTGDSVGPAVEAEINAIVMEGPRDLIEENPPQEAAVGNIAVINAIASPNAIVPEISSSRISPQMNNIAAMNSRLAELQNAVRDRVEELRVFSLEAEQVALDLRGNSIASHPVLTSGVENVESANPLSPVAFVSNIAPLAPNFRSALASPNPLVPEPSNVSVRNRNVNRVPLIPMTASSRIRGGGRRQPTSSSK